MFIWIFSKIYEYVLPRVLYCKHVFEVWGKNHKCFNAQMKVRVRQLRVELKFTDFVLRIKDISNSLLVVEDSISEQNQINLILDGLPKEYNSFVIKMHQSNESPLLCDMEKFLYVQEAQLDKF